MGTAYDAHLLRLDHLLCCSMKKQIEPYLKIQTVSNSCNVEEDLRDFVFVGREIAQCLKESSESEEFYPYPSHFTLENFSALILKKLSYFLDAIFAKSTTSTGQEKINLQKVTIDHVILQWCKKEGYQSPLLLAFSLFVHQITRSCVLIDVLYALELCYHTRLC